MKHQTALRRIVEEARNGHHPSMHGPEEAEFCAACRISDIAEAALAGKPCETCGGIGEVAIEEGAPSVIVSTMVCPECDGERET